MDENLRIIISGGGTGGHIFPAISIANALREIDPQCKILFVGAEGRMEMKKVPDAGYDIKALPICGFDRKNLIRNFSVLLKIFKSRQLAKKIIREFRPMAAVGVGGYASGPTLNVAGRMGIPTILQEQNSYAGVTNKLLARRAQKICVAYEGMERFFPVEKILLTGNPVRQDLLTCTKDKNEILKAYQLDPNRKTILIIGGSLGARTINQSVLGKLDDIKNSNIQIIWQTGSFYFQEILKSLKLTGKPANLFVTDFITHMDEAYHVADLVISRAGASSISELCLLGKPAILVPSPNVAEDHQTKNAMALANKNAAILIRDADAEEKLIPQAILTSLDDNLLNNLAENCKKMAFPDSAKVIARQVYELATKYRDKNQKHENK